MNLFLFISTVSLDIATECPGLRFEPSPGLRWMGGVDHAPVSQRIGVPAKYWYAVVISGCNCPNCWPPKLCTAADPRDVGD